jgi:ribosomal protein S8E
MIQRPKDEPWPGGRGVYDWQRGGFVRVIKAESADTYVRRMALTHPRIIQGSTAERCALNGGGRFWTGPRAKGE